MHKKYNIQKKRYFTASVRRIQRHDISVAGPFIMGLDVDRPDIGVHIADTANRYGVDVLRKIAPVLSMKGPSSRIGAYERSLYYGKIRPTYLLRGRRIWVYFDKSDENLAGESVVLAWGYPH